MVARVDQGFLMSSYFSLLLMSGSHPTFLGIGAPKAGSTWLYELLRTHPEVGMSERRREIHYFDRNYDRGQAWYMQFFEEVDGYKVTGEFSPTYLYCDELTERIAESAPSVQKLVVSLRNPVDQIFSLFAFRVRTRGYEGSFEQFLDKGPAIYRCMHGVHLERLRPWIERGALLSLVFEEAVKDVENTKMQLATFLGVDPALFPEEAGHSRINYSYAPRYKRLYVWAVAFSQRLRRGDHDRLINFAKQTGIKRLFDREGTFSVPPMQPATRRRLVEIFEPDVAALEKLLGRPMTQWRDTWARELGNSG